MIKQILIALIIASEENVPITRYGNICILFYVSLSYFVSNCVVYITVCVHSYISKLNCHAIVLATAGS